MTIRRTLELAALAIALIIAAAATHAWFTSRDEQQRLATTLAQQKQIIEAADTRERDRQATLARVLAQIENLKRTTQTPRQIVTALPKYLSLPQPIALAPEGSLPISTGKGTDDSATGTLPLPSGPMAQIPSADLKPLYDYVQDCRACEIELAAAKQNESDDNAKISALTAQRDAAISAAKGGTFWRRLRRDLTWLGVGAALGTAAYHASHRRP